jgi:hypothetical protein
MRNYLSRHRLLLAAGALLAATSSAHAQDSWAALARTSGTEAQLPADTRDAMTAECAGHVPEALLLASPVQGSSNSWGSLSVLRGGRWVKVNPPAAADTLRVTLVGVSCAANPVPSYPPTVSLVLAAEGNVLRYDAPAEPLRGDAGPDLFPMVRGESPGGPVVMGYLVDIGLLAPAEQVRQLEEDVWHDEGWTDVQIAAVRAHRVLVGMTGVMVDAALGRPTETHGMEDTAGTFIAREFPTQSVYLRNGRVIAIRPK